MEYGLDSQYEKRVLRWSVTAAIFLHFAVVVGLILVGHSGTEEKFTPLAVMDFAHYDPDGGEPGGADNDDVAFGPAPAPAPVRVPTRVPVSAPAPAPIPVSEPMPEIIESVSEKAEIAPFPPPKETLAAKATATAVASGVDRLGEESKHAGGGQGRGETSDGGSGQGWGGTGGGGPGQGRGGIGGGKGMGNPNALNAYTTQIRRRLERYKKYPQSAQIRNIQGIVTVSFSIDRDGSVRSPRLVHSSDHVVLDEEVMALLKRAAPMPPIPKEVSQNSISLVVPIKFSVR